MFVDPNVYTVDDAANQDALRSVRQFVGMLSGVLNDQSMAGQDGYSGSVPGQFTTVGPYSTSVEGRPVAVTRAGGVVISPQLVLIGLGIAAALLWKHHF